MSDFGVIRSHESEGVRFGKLFAEIYYYMGKNIIEAMGEEEGAKVIAKAVEEFGQDRVASMRAEAAERGIAVDSEDAYFMVRDMPGCGWETRCRNGCQREFSLSPTGREGPYRGR